MALVSLETASSTENLRSFKNQRIMSSSSLPFLPVGRPGCSLASRSFTSTTSFARDTVQPTPDKQGQPIVSATHPIPLLMARGSVCRDTDQRSSGVRGIRKSLECQEASGAAWCLRTDAPGCIWLPTYLGGGGGTTGPRRGGAAAALRAPGEAPGERRRPDDGAEGAGGGHLPPGSRVFGTLRRRIVGDREQPERRKRGRARPTPQRVLSLSCPSSAVR